MVAESGGAPAPLRLGVVVPTLDEAERIGALVARLLDPAGPPEDRADHVVVSDGGSSDDTAARARAAGAEVLIGSPGRGPQLARGAECARGDVLLFLHADTLPQAGALAAVRRAFGDERVAATAMRQRIDAQGLVYRAIERAAALRVRVTGMVYGDSGLAVRRSAYRAVGGFRALPIFEDRDLSRRLRRAGRVLLVEGALLSVSARRWRADGPLRRTLLNWMLTAGYAAGLSPERLARAYPPRRRP